MEVAGDSWDCGRDHVEVLAKENNNVTAESP